MKLKLTFQDKLIECGTDEAGRGCLAGPVTAAAVILPAKFNNDILNDSKKLSESQRDTLRTLIKNNAIAYAVAHIYPEEIDHINILQASIKAMHTAIRNLTTSPEFIAVDGNKFNPFPNCPHECIIKGDSKYLNIAAASILAKTERDAYMKKIHEEHPQYNWYKNKGYPTKEHREAIKKYGSTTYHRKSFKLLPEQLRLDI